MTTTTHFKEKRTMAESTKTASGGIGFGGMLAILFIGLKLTGYIDWSWWWVLSPLWIPVGILLAIAVVGLLVYGAVRAFGK